ncbi:MAG TPA: DUF692 family protein [Kofleriaceae bacterium]|nr:DUF692 family protein [Kofleriaceae bacterium]
MARDLAALPVLGVGISAEFDSARRGIDALALRGEEPGLIDFLEYGCDLARGLDQHARRWAAAGLPATYHFLDLNLTEPRDADADWLEATGELARELGAAWLCGDGGLWHFGPRDRGHETLLPPILTAASADEMGEAVRRVEEATGLACLPENPPAPIYLGDLHILDYFARVADRSGGGLLVDCAHLAIFQRMRGHAPLTGLDGFPLDRVVELHVAGGVERDHDGFAWIDDDHQPEPLAETWAIFEHIAPRARNLKAVVYECERNPPADVVDNFRRIRATWAPRS